MATKKKSDFIDIKGLVKLYLSKWYLFVISAVVICGCAYLYLKSKNKEYNVRANVLVTEETPSLLDGLGDMTSMFGAGSEVDDEIFVISSHSLYKDLAKKLGLNITHEVKAGFLKKYMAYPDFPIQASYPQEILDTLKGSVTVKVKTDKAGKADIEIKGLQQTLADEENVTLPKTYNTPYGPLTVSMTDKYPKGKEVSTTIGIEGYDAAAEHLSEIISAEIASKKSKVIELSLNTSNTKYGLAVLNNLIELYNVRGVMEKNQQGEKTADFIDRRLELLSGDLTGSETEIQNYKQHHGIVDVKTEAQYQTKVRANIDEALIEAETMREVLKMTRQFISSPDNEYAVVPTKGGENEVGKGIDSYNALILKRISLAKSAKPGNRALAQLDDQIRAMKGSLIAQVDNEIDGNDATIRELYREMGQAKGRLSQVPLQEREFRDLQRQQTVKQELYVFLLQRREETALMLANAMPKATIIDEAYSLSRPIGMSKMTIMIIVLMCAMCVPPLYLYIRKITKTKFDTREEAEGLIGAPVLGEISTSNYGHNLVCTPGSNSSAAELFRLMRTKLLFILNGKENKVVMVTSSRSGEGKTFISINLAASLSLMENKKVLLIGMDLRKPRLAEYLDVPLSPGLSQYLSSGDIKLSDIIKPIKGLDSLSVIAAGPVPPNPSELLTSEKLENMMKELRETYDYIVIDTAPSGMVSDAFMVNRLADATIYVVRAKYTMRSEINELNRLEEEDRLKRLSVIVNGTPRTVNYGYGENED